MLAQGGEVEDSKAPILGADDALVTPGRQLLVDGLTRDAEHLRELGLGEAPPEPRFVAVDLAMRDDQIAELAREAHRQIGKGEIADEVGLAAHALAQELDDMARQP